MQPIGFHHRVGAKKSRRKGKSFYDLYPMPFFKPSRFGICFWHVHPTGDYLADCETGRRYALEFLRSYDGTVGWAWLLQSIVADMIGAGPEGAWPSGDPKVDGTVIGFMGVIGKAACLAMSIGPVPTNPDAA
jgi:hypothetical protein